LWGCPHKSGGRGLRKDKKGEPGGSTHNRENDSYKKTVGIYHISSNTLDISCTSPVHSKVELEARSLCV